MIPQIRAGMELAGWKDILFNFFRYFFIIGLGEEILYRGYIQTRIYGIIKSDALAVLFVGALFSAAHFPFQTYALGLSVGQYFREAALSLVFWHTVHNALYRKYRTLSGPVILHGLIDFALALFR